MQTDRELKTDVGIIVLMALYGLVIVRSSPISAIAAWMIGGLLLLRHTVEPFGDFVEEHQFLFLVALFAILTAGVLLSQL
jgi:hypothetical protein